MDIHPIKTEEDYELAMARLDVIFHSKEGTSEADELDLLATLIEKYEDEHYPIPLPDPIEAIKFRMEQMGYNQTDLSELLGEKSRASEILNKKRKLTLPMIRLLNESWKIPTEVLVQEYEVKYGKK
jgi:HTH-type transcriptional regulator/antitoxin HigA